MGKFTKQADNIRKQMEQRVKQIEYEIALEGQQRIEMLADNMVAKVISTLKGLPFLKRLSFCGSILFAPIITKLSHIYHRIYHAKEETTPSDTSQ